MRNTKTLTVLGLFVAVFLPLTASAAIWTTPSGAVVDDYGILIYFPYGVIQAAPPVQKKPLVAPLIIKAPIATSTGIMLNPQSCPHKKGSLRAFLFCR